MADTVGRMEVVLAARIDQFERNVARAEARMTRAAAKMNQSAQQVDDRMAQMGERFGISIPTRATLVTAAIAGVGLALRSAIAAGEEMRSLEGRFRALTGSAERAAGMVESVLGVSSRTGDTLSTVSELQSRFLLAARELGATDDQVGRFTESLLKLGRIGGSSSDAIANGTMQLAQGLAGGVIRAEEFNSLMENTPLIVQAIADSMGVTLGEMRALMLDGRLLADDVFQAILSQSEKIDAKFQEIPQTSSQAWTRATNAMTLVLSQLDDAAGLSSTWVSILNGVASVMERIAAAAPTVESSVAGLSDERKRARLVEVQRNIRTAMLAGDEEALLSLRREEAALTNDNRAVTYPGFQTGADQALAAAQVAAANPYSDRAYTQMMVDAYGAAGRSAPAAGPLTPIDVITPTPATTPSRSRSLAPSDVDRAVERLEDMTRAMVEQAEAVGLADEALARYTAESEAARIEAEAAASATPEQRAELERLGQAYVDAAVQADSLRRAESDRVEAAREAERVNELLVDSISGAIVNAESFEDAIKRLTLALVEMGLKAALLGEGPLGKMFDGGSSGGAPGWFGLLGTAISAAAGGLFGGGVASPYSGFSTAEVASQYASYGAGRIVPSALGNAFDRGRVIPFANGGIVDAPTFFPMARGVGLMGEAGPEAIIPLERGAGGKLGVRSSGGGAVDVRVYMDKDGDWQAEVERISGNVAAKTYDRREPGTIKRVGDEMEAPGSRLHRAAKGASGGGYYR